jgi:ribose transport system permease protein
MIQVNEVDTAANVATEGEVTKRPTWASVFRSKSWLPAILTSVVLIVVGQILSPGFGSWGNINNILGAAAILAIVSTGQSLVMVSGNFGIDLSVGQVMSLTAIVAYMTMDGGAGYLPLAIAAIVVVGGLLGGLSGVLVSWVRLPALVVTLGTMVVAQGIVMVLASNGTPAGSVPGIVTDLTTQSILGIKYVTLVAVVFLVGMTLVATRLRFGKMLFLVGSYQEAARLAGLPLRRIIFWTFVFAGACSGFAGLLLLSYAGQANLDLGSQYLLLSIAATVIGGTSLAGGEGGVPGAAAGAIAFIVINSLMQSMGFSDATRQMLVGAVLMVLLAFNARTPKLRL